MSKTKTAQELNLRMNNEQSIHIKFETEVSTNPFRTVIDSITYKIPNTTDNRSKLLALATKRYGKPSKKSGDLSADMWYQIDSTSSSKTCKKYTPVLSLMSGFLSLSSGGKYKKAFVEFEQSKKMLTLIFK